MRVNRRCRASDTCSHTYNKHTSADLSELNTASPLSLPLLSYTNLPSSSQLLSPLLLSSSLYFSHQCSLCSQYLSPRPSDSRRLWSALNCLSVYRQTVQRFPTTTSVAAGTVIKSRTSSWSMFSSWKPSYWCSNGKSEALHQRWVLCVRLVLRFRPKSTIWKETSWVRGWNCS